ncbi:MAG: Gfo/Idh/MocA family oxidoreductase [Chloroflexota bacterium]
MPEISATSCIGGPSITRTGFPTRLHHASGAWTRPGREPSTAAHIVDLAHYVVGPIDAITGSAKTFITERPSVDDPSRMEPVTVDDCFAFLARFQNGVTGTFEKARGWQPAGQLNYNDWEINGTRGSLAFNLERLNELQVFFSDDPVEHRGWRVINVTDGQHPYVGAWWPSGHIIGWEESHIHQIADFLMAIENDQPCTPGFAVGVQNQAVLDALVESAGSGRWVDVAQE